MSESDDDYGESPEEFNYCPRCGYVGLEDKCLCSELDGDNHD